MSDGRGSPASSRVAAAVGGAGAHAGRWAVHPRPFVPSGHVGALRLHRYISRCRSPASSLALGLLCSAVRSRCRSPASSLALGRLCSTARSRCRSLVYRHVCLLLACSAPQSLLCSQVSGTIATFIGARPALAAALRHHRYDRWRSACAALLRSGHAGALRHHRYVRWLLAGSGLRSDRAVALRLHRYGASAYWQALLSGSFRFQMRWTQWFRRRCTQLA